MAIKFPGELLAPDKPELAASGGLAVSAVGGVEKYGTLDADETAITNIDATSLSVSTLSSIAADLGTITAGTITGATFKTAASGSRVEITAAGSKIVIYDSSGDPYMEIDNEQIIFSSRSSKSSETNAIYYYNKRGDYGFKTRMEDGNWAITQSGW